LRDTERSALQFSEKESNDGSEEEGEEEEDCPEAPLGVSGTVWRAASLTPPAFFLAAHAQLP
jgi:hypothetical protein